MKSSVIFLDIDGVLNSKRYCTEMFEKTRCCKLEDLKPNSLIREMDPEIIQRVARLASETDSSVVLSSSWKHMWNDSVSNGLAKADMQLMFETFGLHVEDEATPDVESGNRPVEIKMFCKVIRKLNAGFHLTTTTFRTSTSELDFLKTLCAQSMTTATSTEGLLPSTMMLLAVY